MAWDCTLYGHGWQLALQPDGTATLERCGSCGEPPPQLQPVPCRAAA